MSNSQTPRQRVRNALTFSHPDRVPRDVWVLPWVTTHYPEEWTEMNARFPGDIVTAPSPYRPSTREQGDQYAVGEYTDEWGCVFQSVQAGAIGEVKAPILNDTADWQSIRPPYEMLPDGDEADARDSVNRFCAETDLFVKAACCPRPWERYQFIRGTENSLIDVMMPDTGRDELLRRVHEFYLKELEFWVKTDVDAIFFMDDWGAQQQLLIPPHVWRERFKPLYRDYCDIAHAGGKFTLMHSDGCITEIYEDLIEVGVDALNSQLFVMDMAELERAARGRITFWGEICRQHVLPASDPQVGRDAVRKVVKHLYDPAGGIIAQFEFGLGANPETARAILEEWERVDSEARGD